MKASGRASTGVKRALSRQQSGRVLEDIRLYAGIAHQLHVGIAIWHLENLEDPKTFHLIFANPAAERYLSVPSETVYGKTMAGIFPERVYPLPDHCVCLELEDLTDQRNAARTISNQAQLLDLVTDTIFARDMDGRVTYWNQSAERMYGWTKEEVLGQSTFELLKTEQIGRA